MQVDAFGAPDACGVPNTGWGRCSPAVMVVEDLVGVVTEVEAKVAEALEEANLAASTVALMAVALAAGSARWCGRNGGPLLLCRTV